MRESFPAQYPTNQRALCPIYVVQTAEDIQIFGWSGTYPTSEEIGDFLEAGKQNAAADLAVLTWIDTEVDKGYEGELDRVDLQFNYLRLETKEETEKRFKQIEGLLVREYTNLAQQDSSREKSLQKNQQLATELRQAMEKLSNSVA